jgi:copper transport protein
VYRRLLAALAGLIGIAAALGLPLIASAHALAQTSDPAPGATLGSSPAAVTITFGETPDASLSMITVVDTTGSSWTAGASAPVSGKPDELSVPLKHLPNGVYTVTWRTVSAVDGHSAAGSFAFGVGVSPASAPPTPSTVASPPPSALAVAMRWLFLAGIIATMGVVVTALFIVHSLPSALRVLLIGAGIAALGGAIGIVEAQRETAGISWSAAFNSSLGHALFERGAPAVAMLLIAVAIAGWRRFRRSLLWILGGAAFAAVATEVLTSHATSESPVALNFLMQYLHLSAIGVWIGALAALLLALRGEASDQKARRVRRFSALAGWTLLLVAATGVGRAVFALASWTALVSTAFGVFVLVKIGLLLILAALGAINRFVNVPQAARHLRGLRRVGSAEVFIGAVTVAIAALLVNLAPPVAQAQAGAGPQSLVATGSDLGTTVKARLTVSPGTAGVNVFSLRLNDYDSGQPVAADKVVLEFRVPARPEIGSSTLVLSKEGDGAYGARSANLSIDGTYDVTILVERGVLSTEVDLRLTTISTPPQVTITRFAGLPTVYTVHLAANRAVQVYLDPDKPGRTEFHATFLDAGGQELQVANAEIGQTAADGSVSVLTIRRLDPVGHFVADASVPARSTRFDISGTLPNGDVVASYILITPGA